MGTWLEILVKEEGIIEDWVFQHREGYQMKISDVDKGFQQGLRRVQLEEVGLIPEGLDVGEEISFRRLLRRLLTTEVLNNRMDSSVISLNNRLRKRERGWGG